MSHARFCSPLHQLESQWQSDRAGAIREAENATNQHHNATMGHEEEKAQQSESEQDNKRLAQVFRSSVV